MKNLSKMAFAVVAFVAASFGSFRVHSAYTADMSESNLLIQANVEALAAGGEGSGTGYTGPRDKYDCPGWFTGDGFDCKCTNQSDCTPDEC